MTAESLALIQTPMSLAELTLRSQGEPPPTMSRCGLVLLPEIARRLADSPIAGFDMESYTPNEFFLARVPVGSPRTFPRIWIPDEPEKASTRIAANCWKLSMIRPRIVTPPARTSSPFAIPASPPLISMRRTASSPARFACAPGCVNPSMAVPGHEIAGKAVAGEIVWIPGPGMLNVIVCAAQFASTKLIASRSDPAPLSLVLTTTSGSVTATDGEYSELRTQPSPQVSTLVAVDTLFQRPPLLT